MARLGATLERTLYTFVLRFIRTLFEWYVSFGEYQKIEFINSNSIIVALARTHNEFISQETNMYNEAHFEYFQMKCCSYQRADLYKHYREMSKRHHLLWEINDPCMKQAFITSLPKKIASKVFKLIEVKNKQVPNLSLGEIF